MTSQDLKTRIKRLEDIEEIKRLEARYVYFVDTLQINRGPAVSESAPA